MGDPTCHPRGFLFAPVDLMKRCSCVPKITVVVLAIFFGCAALSEIVLFFFNWEFYGDLAGLIAELIDFHKKLHAVRSDQKSEQLLGYLNHF